MEWNRLVRFTSMALATGFISFCLARGQSPQSSSIPASLPVTAQQDGPHDFDFLSDHWKAHVRRLADRLFGSNIWVAYDGISNHKKLLDTNANDSPARHIHIQAQTLRRYNPESQPSSIYLLDVNKGVLSQPPVVGEFTRNRGEFFDEEDKRSSDFCSHVWLNISPKSARMEQSFSPDGGKTRAVNWICELPREAQRWPAALPISGIIGSFLLAAVLLLFAEFARET